MPKKQRIITLEEHYLDRDIKAQFAPIDATRGDYVVKRLDDLGALRIKEMDEAGVDVQVLSHGNPAVQKMGAEMAIRLARQANDRLYKTVQAYPDRFAAFAAIPTPDPKAAADELERTVTKLGFKGAMIHGLTNGVFLDKKQFWPIFERAQALDVPLYLHPSQPHPAVIEAYYQDYAEEFPWLIRAAWGYGVETATQGIRLILSGVFDKYPSLKIILGHLGEGLPFFMWRINQALSREGLPVQESPMGGSWAASQALSRDSARGKNFRDYFMKHFYITTSGFFSSPALLCCVMELGVDRILFSVDYPFADNLSGTKWMDTVPLSEEDRTKILSGNAAQLLKI